MPERKDRMALLSRYSKLHTAKYGQKPQINLNVEQWAADALIDSYTIQGCYDLLQYYFEVAQNPNWKYFANYAHEIVDRKEQYKQDLAERQERRQLAKKWLSE
jgi:hypothetical protein